MSKMEELARAKGFEHARVLSKVNKHGELVVAVLIPPRAPGEWEDAPLESREQKKTSREKR
ncbi:MAG TPA: hypothetical protein VH137_10685 [Gemmatimonadales bacterium]|nr:hypothetical protein [Gemmatimonadales bacterium]